MTCLILDCAAEYINDLRQIYFDSRQYAFPWLDTAAFQLSDFDAATEDEVIRVAVVDGRPVGFVSWYAPDNFIHHLFVDPGWMGRGVGRALLEDCLGRMGRPAQLKCLHRNTLALLFYQQLGWHTVEEGESADGRYFLLSLG